MILQLESQVGVKVNAIGVGICSPEARAKCGLSGCWMNIDIGSRFSLIDANSSAVVGPALGLSTSCGCRRNFYEKRKLKGHHPTAHALIENAFSRTCTKTTCLNGGRCIPTKKGYK